MLKLLSANLGRLKTNSLFYIITFLVIAISVFFSSKGYLLMFGDYMEVESAIMIAAALPAGFNTLFIGFFLGREYSDKTIRNKLTVGYTRNEVYAASLITTSLITAFWVALWFISGIFGAYLTGAAFSMTSLAAKAVVVLFYNLAFSSALTAVSMAVHSRALAIVLHTQIPPYLITFVLVNGMPLQYEAEASPVMAEIRKFIVNLTPMGQWFYCSVDESYNVLYSKPFLILLSAAVIIMFTAVGLKVFEKKELK